MTKLTKVQQTALGVVSTGSFYFSLESARVAHRWRIANYAARKLLDAQTKEPT